MISTAPSSVISALSSICTISTMCSARKVVDAEVAVVQFALENIGNPDRGQLGRGPGRDGLVEVGEP